METSIFCDKHGLDGVGYVSLPAEMGGDGGQESQCAKLIKLVRRRLEPDERAYHRTPLVVVPVDSPDGRQLKLVVWEGEQHNLLQAVGDWLLLNHMDSVAPLPLAEQVNMRLPNPVLQVLYRLL